MDHGSLNIECQSVINEVKRIRIRRNTGLTISQSLLTVIIDKVEQGDPEMLFDEFWPDSR
jgi:hypothetical protein